MVCDSNILIYAVEPDDAVCLPFVERPDALIASITRIEVLGFHGFHSLPLERQRQLRTIFANTNQLPLDEDIIVRAVAVRQQRRMKLGDSIIAATALEFGVPLVTRNTEDFRGIPGLELIDPFDVTGVTVGP